MKKAKSTKKPKTKSKKVKPKKMELSAYSAVLSPSGERRRLGELSEWGDFPN